MVGIIEATRRVHITRRSTQQTRMEEEIGVQLPGVDVSLLVISDMSSAVRIGAFAVGSMVVESTPHTDDSREHSRHHWHNKFSVSSRLAAHFGMVETAAGKQRDRKYREKAKEMYAGNINAQSSWDTTCCQTMYSSTALCHMNNLVKKGKTEHTSSSIRQKCTTTTQAVRLPVSYLDPLTQPIKK